MPAKLPPADTGDPARQAPVAQQAGHVQVLHTVLLGGEGDAPINQLHRAGGVLFALCDSSIPGRDDGLLAPETLAWLRGVLATADAPVIVGLHHHPIPLHNPLVDGVRLGNADEFAAVVGEFAQVVAVLCGHAHAAAAGTFAGRPLIAAPGVVSTARLPWTTDEELTWTNTVDLDDAPGVEQCLKPVDEPWEGYPPELSE